MSQVGGYWWGFISVWDWTNSTSNHSKDLWRYFTLIPAVLEELGELFPLLDDLSEHVTYPLDDELKWGHRIPLSVHARHTLDDALTAFGLLDIGKKLTNRQESSGTRTQTVSSSS